MGCGASCSGTCIRVRSIGMYGAVGTSVHKGGSFADAQRAAFERLNLQYKDAEIGQVRFFGRTGDDGGPPFAEDGERPLPGTTTVDQLAGFDWLLVDAGEDWVAVQRQQQVAAAGRKSKVASAGPNSANTAVGETIAAGVIAAVRG
eukprot:TRINITY_DN49953_c0_g1_i1.p2 TRINITY_DN49953_c0_g1~~TRINITY_DN49953_c0_g1_i1.p2  ORF type:complete len:146 (-),score=30.46 TRINITY_DN49953_c0_g1_i1:335-772(-)